MSGHSKWANIKHRKGKSDEKKGKTFTKIGRELSVAVKSGGANPEKNFRLKDVIAKAKAVNMPNDSISRSIKKAAGEIDTTDYEEILYEGYGIGGIAVIVEALTDNRNRTAADIRHYFDKFKGNLGTQGCVSFMFDKKGIIIIEKKDEIDEDTLMMEVLEAGADDLNSTDDYYEIIINPNEFSIVREALEKAGYTFFTASIDMIPQMMVKLRNEEQITYMESLIEHLLELDDVQNIYHNWELE